MYYFAIYDLENVPAEYYDDVKDAIKSIGYTDKIKSSVGKYYLFPSTTLAKEVSDASNTLEEWEKVNKAINSALPKGGTIKTLFVTSVNAWTGTLEN